MRTALAVVLTLWIFLNSAGAATVDSEPELALQDLSGVSIQAGNFHGRAQGPTKIDGPTRRVRQANLAAARSSSRQRSPEGLSSHFGSSLPEQNPNWTCTLVHPRRRIDAIPLPDLARGCKERVVWAGMAAKHHRRSGRKSDRGSSVEGSEQAGHRFRLGLAACTGPQRVAFPVRWSRFIGQDGGRDEVYPDRSCVLTLLA